MYNIAVISVIKNDFDTECIVHMLIPEFELEKCPNFLAHTFSLHRPRRIYQVLSLPWTRKIPLMMMRENVWRSRCWPKSLKANM